MVDAVSVQGMKALALVAVYKVNLFSSSILVFGAGVCEVKGEEWMASAPE